MKDEFKYVVDNSKYVKINDTKLVKFYWWIYYVSLISIV